MRWKKGHKIPIYIAIFRSIFIFFSHFKVIWCLTMAVEDYSHLRSPTRFKHYAYVYSSAATGGVINDISVKFNTKWIKITLLTARLQVLTGELDPLEGHFFYFFLWEFGVSFLLVHWTKHLCPNNNSEFEKKINLALKRSFSLKRFFLALNFIFTSRLHSAASLTPNCQLYD